MKKSALAVLILFVTTTLAISAAGNFEFVESFEISGESWDIFEIHNLTEKVTADGMAYTLKEIPSTNDADTELFIGFEDELSDFANYRLIDSDFLINPFQRSTGISSGKFYRSEHSISLLPRSTSIFYPGTVPGSFTIEFDLYLYQSFDYQYVISYQGQNLSDESDSSTYGFAVYIEDQKLHYEFKNFFWSIDGEPTSVTISEEDKLSTHEWQHHALTFNIMSGMMATYQDGVEQDLIYVTEDESFFSPIYNPEIKEELSAAFIIGKDAFFSLDDFKISKNSTSEFSMGRYDNEEAYLTTDVYQFCENLGTLKEISYDVTASDYSQVRLAYRISENYFLPENTLMDWLYVENGIDEFPEEFERGRYIQFKVEAYPYAENNEEISIHSIDFDYSEDSEPDSPVLLSVVPGDEAVTLTWLPATEQDVVGYEVYYGTLEQNYICSDSPLGESPIYIEYEQEGELEPIEFELSGLNNEQAYFVSVRTIDENQNRSGYSSELFAIPSSIYNGFGFSVNR